MGQWAHHYVFSFKKSKPASKNLYKSKGYRQIFLGEEATTAMRGRWYLPA